MKYQLWSWHLTYCKAHYRYKSYKLGLNQTCKLSLNSTFCEAGKPLSGSFRYLHQWWNALQASDPLLWFTGNIDARPPATLDTLLEIWTFMNRVLNTHITLSLRLQWWAALCPRYVTPKLALRFSAHIRQARRLTVVTQHWGFWRSRRYHYERHICSNRWTFGDVGGDIGVSGWCTKYGGEFSRDPSDIQLSDTKCCASARRYLTICHRRWLLMPGWVIHHFALWSGISISLCLSFESKIAGHQDALVCTADSKLMLRWIDTQKMAMQRLSTLSSRLALESQCFYNYQSDLVLSDLHSPWGLAKSI